MESHTQDQDTPTSASPAAQKLDIKAQTSDGGVLVVNPKDGTSVVTLTKLQTRMLFRILANEDHELIFHPHLQNTVKHRSERSVLYTLARKGFLDMETNDSLCDQGYVVVFSLNKGVKLV